MLECLYTPKVEKATALTEELLSMRSIFLSRMVYQTYNGYVLSQFKKMQADLRNNGQVKWKHVMHLIRLLLSGICIMREGFVPLLTGIHLMKTGAVEANLVQLNESYRLPYIPEPIEQKVVGAEKGLLEWLDMAFHQQEYERLRSELQQAYQESALPEAPKGAAALHDLLVRIRLGKVSKWSCTVIAHVDLGLKQANSEVFGSCIF